MLTTLMFGVAVGIASFALATGGRGRSLHTDDGFVLRFGDDGDIVTTAPSGFSLRDFAAKSEFVRPQGALQTGPDGSLRRVATAGALGLQLTASYRAVGAAIRIDGEIQDLTGKDRAVTVHFAYLVDAVGWQWHDDQRSARTIEPGQQYGAFAERGAGSTGTASRWPLACVSGPNDGLVIGAPLNLPRLWRFGYDAKARELYAEVDLGLTPETREFPSRASFSLVLYRSDPQWGFRSALERYYLLFPDCFIKRNAKEGIWMPFTDIETVQGFGDFGFQFKEGDNNVPFDQAHGIYSFVYVEPWSNWVRMPKEMPRTLDNAVNLAKERAKEGSHKDQATTTSAIEGPDGRWAARIENQPWCDGAVICVNPNPAVPTQPAAVTQFQNLWGHVERAFERNPDLTGVYHDSFEMYLFPRALNYRREHFADVDTPLAFDSEGQLCQTVMFDMVDFARATAERMWSKGKMTFANGVPFETPWGAAWLDVMGTEFGGNASDDIMNYWRALCYQRPYLLLLNTDYNTFPAEGVVAYMKHAAAYGFFPSFFSHNASEDPYWQNPALYNRDRPIFRKYIPIISALSAAGWEPVSYARSSNPRVYVERFGNLPGPLHFTLFNDSDQAQEAKITFDLPHVKSGAKELLFRELIAAGGLRAEVAGGAASLHVIVQPRDVKVLRVE